MLAGLLVLPMVATPAMAGGHKSEEPAKKESQYPNATRKEPKLDLTKQSDADQLNKGLAAVNSGDSATAKQILQPFADGTGTKSKYVQALAQQGLANVAYHAGDMNTAIDLLQKALANGVLPNDTYFGLEYELAQFYLIHGDYQKSIDTVEKWRAEGRKETADSYALEGKAYYRLDQYQKAIDSIKKAMSMTDKPDDSWNQVLAASYAETGNSDEALATAKQQLAKHPGDMTTLNNTVSLLVGANKYSEALDLMQDAYKKGEFKESKSYITLAKLHLMKAQDANDPKPEAQAAVTVIKDGISKGIVKPDYQAYRVEGDAAYLSDDIKGAITAYDKASTSAPDGELDLQTAKLLLSEKKFSAGRLKARSALKRGIKHEGEAYVVIAESERAMHNESAAIAAMRKAEKDPTTRAKAQAWLKKVSR
ncbi:hypothetical protein LF63_0100520 [Oleiagrimonas soli]|uniref:Uncharacterized protein n=1 Tax=Oleiagrimonas soli TaxID=1543381 RepID=A0A099CZS8_9GAMM|nr:hypothetical protein LF63_0100520 [Oleiagrimonas soli]